MIQQLKKLINFSYKEDYNSINQLLIDEPLLFLYNYKELSKENFLIEYLFLHIFYHYRMHPITKKEQEISNLINKNLEFLHNNQIFNNDIYIENIFVQGNLFLYNYSKSIRNFNNYVDKPITTDLLIKLLKYENADPNTMILHENNEEVLLFSLIYQNTLDYQYIVPFFNSYLDVDLVERKNKLTIPFNPEKERYNTLTGVLFESLEERQGDINAIFTSILYLIKNKVNINNPYYDFQDNNIYKMFKYTNNLSGKESNNSDILNFLITNINKYYTKNIFKSLSIKELNTLSNINPNFYIKLFSFK